MPITLLESQHTRHLCVGSNSACTPEIRDRADHCPTDRIKIRYPGGTRAVLMAKETVVPPWAAFRFVGRLHSCYIGGEELRDLPDRQAGPDSAATTVYGVCLGMKRPLPEMRQEGFRNAVENDQRTGKTKIVGMKVEAKYDNTGEV